MLKAAEIPVEIKTRDPEEIHRMPISAFSKTKNSFPTLYFPINFWRVMQHSRSS